MSSRGTHSHRRFRRLPVPKQIAVATLAAVQLALLIWAQIDIRRRPDDQVIGPKLCWRLVCLINFVGPLSYLRWGRKHMNLMRPDEAGEAPARSSARP